MASRGAYRLFVANLPWTVGHRELRQHFSQFGHVVGATVVFNRSTGMSKGYGFVHFADKKSFTAAGTKPSQMLEGRMLDVQMTS